MTNQEKEALAAISFSCFYQIGPRSIKKLLDRFKTINRSYNASFKELKGVGIKEETIYNFLKFRQSFCVEKVLNRLKEEKISFVHIKEDLYPWLLKEIFDPPIVLYFKGNINFDFNKSLAIVGSRNNSLYGKQVIDKIIPSLVKKSLLIISGLAIGIDSLAQKRTIINGGKTIAVLASSLEKENIYPKINSNLAEEIIYCGGAIISEFPLKIKPLKQNFPLRNRIISGMSKAVLIIEAQEKSGSLITAKQALEQGREVMAVPGSIFSDLSKGSNSLISLGAKLIAKDSDIYEFFIN